MLLGGSFFERWSLPSKEKYNHLPHLKFRKTPSPNSNIRSIFFFAELDTSERADIHEYKKWFQMMIIYATRPANSGEVKMHQLYVNAFYEELVNNEKPSDKQFIRNTMQHDLLGGLDCNTYTFC